MKRRPAEKNKNIIIEAAKKVVSQEGVNKATLREIAKAAGISIGSLYYHYNSKHLILYDVMDENTSESAKIAKAITGGDTANFFAYGNAEKTSEYLVGKIKERIKGVFENKIFFYLAQEAIMGDQEMKEKIKEKYRVWIDAIEKIVANILSAPESSATRVAAIIINAAIDGFMLQRLLEIEYGVESELTEMGALLLRGDFESVTEMFSSRQL